MTAKRWRQLFLIAFIVSICSVDGLLYFNQQWFFFGLVTWCIVGIIGAEIIAKVTSGKTVSTHYLQEVAMPNIKMGIFIVALAVISVAFLALHLTWIK